MAVKSITSFSTGIQANMRRLMAGGNVTVGAAAMQTAKEASNRNVEVSVWRQGDSAVIPSKEDLESTLFVQDIDGNNAFGVCLDLVGGASKVLYLSSLKKSAVPYSKVNEQFVPGNVVESNTPLAQECRSCATMAEIVDVLAKYSGKTLTVQKVDKVQTARYRDGIPFAFRNTNVPYFAIEEPATAGA